MSMTLEEAWQEEAYDRMVQDVLDSHKDDIIGEFISERMASYYKNHPDLTDAAERVIGEAKKLLELSPTASLVFSRAAVEITLRDVLLKPVAFGMVHDDTAGPLITELVVGNRQFTRLLFAILESHGLDLKQAKRQGASISIWAEMESIKDIRNRVVHYGEIVTRESAELSLALASILLHKLYPKLRQIIVGS